MGDNAPTSDLLAVNELLSTMKSTLSALGKTFETLGEQTTKVAELGPAMEATHQVVLIRSQLTAQYARQDVRMQEVKTLLRDVLKEQLAETLRTRVHLLIQEKVEERVKENVRDQLHNQIPSNLRQEITHHKRQILQVQTSLHNSEARRHNALLSSTAAFSEPLRPLHRPYPTQSPSSMPSMSLTTPVSQTRTIVPSPNMSSAHTETTMLPEEIEPPTPSPLFPRNIADLFAMSPDNARMLVADYGLVKDEGDTPGASPANQNTSESPADTQDMHLNLNRFMAHIGVPYQIVPGSASPMSPAPLVTRIWK